MLNHIMAFPADRPGPQIVLRARKRKKGFTFIRPRSLSGQLQGSLSTAGIRLPIGHPVSDELSLFSLRITKRKLACARTHPHFLTSQSYFSSCPASFAH
ncbi:hypothetical protein ATANTOWER_028239 [Ataeniobius toweri]|uniref:Uncharacterized protein n=1 Tax=Ataeniobius toweri TaxID=208326 RepID=A0ABU7B9S3_9TELE|nr:hypothetical protein [Ataeniobius toweri]